MLRPLLAFTLLAAPPLAAAEPAEVPRGSELRRELFERLRKHATDDTRFHGSLRRLGRWAFFTGETVDHDGDTLTHPPLDNSDAVALWLKTRYGWRLVDHSFGHSDVFYIEWPKAYGVPGALLGLE